MSDISVIVTDPVVDVIDVSLDEPVVETIDVSVEGLWLEGPVGPEGPIGPIGLQGPQGTSGTTITLASNVTSAISSPPLTDTGLKFTAEAGKVYEVELNALVSASVSTATGVFITLDWPDSNVSMAAGFVDIHNYGRTWGFGTADLACTTSNNPAIDVPHYVQAKGMFVTTGVPSSDFIIRLGTEITSRPTTMYAGSTLTYRVLN